MSVYINKTVDNLSLEELITPVVEDVIDDYEHTNHTSNLYLAGDGAPAQPSYTFKNDQDTGIFKFGTDSMSFATGGVERMRIQDSEITLLNENLILDNSSTTDDMFIGTRSRDTVGQCDLVIFNNNADGNTDVSLGLEFCYTARPPETANPVSNDQRNTTLSLITNRQIGHTVNDFNKVDCLIMTDQGEIRAGGGSIGNDNNSPTYAFTNSTSSGMYYSGSSVNISYAGIDRLNIGSDTTLSTNLITPAEFNLDNNNGELITLSNSSNNIQFSAGGGNRFTVNSSDVSSSVPITLPAGTDTAPSIRFADNLNAGLYYDNSGLFEVFGITSSSGVIPMFFTNGAGTDSIFVQEDINITNDNFEISNQTGERILFDRINDAIEIDSNNTILLDNNSGETLLVNGDNNRVQISAGGFTALEIAGSATLLNNNCRFVDGSVSLPSITFQNNIDTGIYYDSGSVSINFTIDNSNVFSIDSNGATYSIPKLLSDGSPSAPSLAFNNDTDCGLFRIGSNRLGFSIGGSLQGEFRDDLFVLGSTNADTVAKIKTFRNGSSSSFTTNWVNGIASQTEIDINLATTNPGNYVSGLVIVYVSAINEDGTSAGCERYIAQANKIVDSITTWNVSLLTRDSSASNAPTVSIGTGGAVSNGIAVLIQSAGTPDATYTMSVKVEIIGGYYITSINNILP